jgi:hypothetical protein
MFFFPASWHPGTPYAVIMAAERRFIANEWHNPYAVDNAHLHTAPVLHPWLKDQAWDAHYGVRGGPGMRAIQWVSSTLRDHWRRAMSLAHLRCTFHRPEAVVAGGDWRQAFRAQEWAFRAIRAHALKRWLAAVRVAVLAAVCRNSDVADMVLAHLAAWHRALPAEDALPAPPLPALF